jgi:hypothetical protein
MLVLAANSLTLTLCNVCYDTQATRVEDVSLNPDMLACAKGRFDLIEYQELYW